MGNGKMYYSFLERKELTVLDDIRAHLNNAFTVSCDGCINQDVGASISWRIGLLHRTLRDRVADIEANAKNRENSLTHDITKKGMVNHTLFNGLPEHREPDWSKYWAFEICGVMEDFGGCEPIMVPSELYLAKFYSVYGRFGSDASFEGVECITDVATAKMARLVTQRICEMSGIDAVHDFTRLQVEGKS